jgi:hypothetical protein
MSSFRPLHAPSLPHLPRVLDLLDDEEGFLVCQKESKGLGTKNVLLVMDFSGRQLFRADETTDCCIRHCLGALRPFQMEVKDNAGNDLLHLYRPLRCQSGLCPGFLQRLHVTLPDGAVVGTVEQRWAVLRPKFVVRDAEGRALFKITGIGFFSCGEPRFRLQRPNDDTEVGWIRRLRNDFLKEKLHNADTFAVRLYERTTVREKTLLLGALFLLDAIFYEHEVVVYVP